MQHDPLSFPTQEAHFFITGSAGWLEVKTAEPKAQAKPVTVICCNPHPLYSGTMENKVVTTLARAFTSLGVRAIRFNYRGVGKSQGSYAHTEGELEDLYAIVAWLRQVRPQDAVWLAGFSFGSFIATAAAHKVQATQVLTIAPPVHHFNYTGLTLPKGASWLVVQGDADEIVPPAEVFQWLESLADPPRLIVLKGATHFFHGRLIELREIITQHYQPILALAQT